MRGNVASICHHDYDGTTWGERDVFDPLPDELPAEITPELADDLAAWLAHALDRAHELLDLLNRRSFEDPAYFED